MVVLAVAVGVDGDDVRAVAVAAEGRGRRPREALGRVVDPAVAVRVEPVDGRERLLEVAVVLRAAEEDAVQLVVGKRQELADPQSLVLRRAAGVEARPCARRGSEVQLPDAAVGRHVEVARRRVARRRGRRRVEQDRAGIGMRPDDARGPGLVDQHRPPARAPREQEQVGRVRAVDEAAIAGDEDVAGGVGRDREVRVRLLAQARLRLLLRIDRRRLQRRRLEVRLDDDAGEREQELERAVGHRARERERLDLVVRRVAFLRDGDVDVGIGPDEGRRVPREAGHVAVRELALEGDRVGRRRELPARRDDADVAGPDVRQLLEGGLDRARARVVGEILRRLVGVADVRRLTGDLRRVELEDGGADALDLERAVVAGLVRARDRHGLSDREPVGAPVALRPRDLRADERAADGGCAGCEHDGRGLDDPDGDRHALAAARRRVVRGAGERRPGLAGVGDGRPEQDERARVREQRRVGDVDRSRVERIHPGHGRGGGRARNGDRRDLAAGSRRMVRGAGERRRRLAGIGDGRSEQD